MATDKDLINCGTLQKNMNISKDNPEDLIGYNGRLFIAVDLIGKAFDEATAIDREWLANRICEATQKTNYKCNDACKALCDCKGCCAYCLTIADHILQNSTT